MEDAVIEDLPEEAVPEQFEPVEPIEQVAQQPEETVAEEVAMDIQTPVINDLMMALCYPRGTDSFFMTVSGDSAAVLAKKRPGTLPSNLNMLLETANEGEFFTEMLNAGNLIEIQAWQAALRSQGKWQRLSQAVLATTANQTLHATRCTIYRPLAYGTNGSDSQSLIDRVKQSILGQNGAPSGVSVDNISWDAVSFKVPPTSSEILCYKNPDMISQITPEHFTLIDKVEELIGEAIEEKCQEFRGRMNTVADEFLPDMTLYLEQQMAGLLDTERQQRIESIGRGTLISYVDKMQNLFCSGNLPAALQPAKIYACHDVISASELRATIMKLSETQVVQQSTVLQNPIVMNRAYHLTNGTDLNGSNWTKQQQASIIIKRNTDEFMRRAQATMGVRYDNPMRNLQNQLAGSSNTLGQQIQAQTQQPVVQQTEQQQEVSKQQLSVLLACLRLRANAVQQTDWELLPEEDMEHLEIVRYLSRQEVVPSGGQDVLFRVATLMLEEYGNGHNVVKFQGKNLPPELIEMINYTVEGRAKALLMQIPVFRDDANQGGVALKILLYCMMHALAQKQRIALETKQRLSQRVMSMQN